jgi:hypothetical protein
MKTLLKLASIVSLGLSHNLAFAQANPGATLEAEFDCPGAGGAESSTYQIWLYSGAANTNWQAAQDFAAAQDLGGGPGHLATFQNAAEEACVLAAADGIGLGFEEQLWIGLLQVGGPEPAGGWKWVTDEPLIDYVNWASGEPNNADGVEHHGTVGRYGYVGDVTTTDAVGWNDEVATRPSLFGFVIEFDNTVEAQNCEGEPDPDDPDQFQGCNPTTVQNIQVPANNNLQDGDTITEVLLTPGTVTACGPFGFLDPRVDGSGFPIDIRPLNVFAELGGAPASPAGLELILDEYTYGSPCFAVAFGSINFSLSAAFPDGLVVTRLQFPEFVPGLGPVTECYDPIDNPDLQESSQLTYQTDDNFEMVEGTAAAMTEFCFNPSRASTRKFSFGVLNTREHCGIVFNTPTGPAEVLDCFQDLAIAKFAALEQSLDNALPTLIAPRRSVLTRQLNRARSMIRSGNWSKALTRLQGLLDQVNAATWALDDDNLPGDVVMRIENLIYRVELLQQVEDNL